MAILATYVATNQFRVSGDLASKLDSGRAILAYHTNYGSKLVYTNYASYDSTNGYTNVYTVQDESENLLSDLSSVDISSVKPDTSGLGNIPVELLWMFRGLRKGAHVYYNSDSTYKINKGWIHFNDGTKDKILYIPGTLTITPGSLTASTWYYIYLNAPTNGLVVTSSDISITTTAPVLDYVKQGYYSVSKRCIGFFRTDITGLIIWFWMDDLTYYWNMGAQNWYTGTSSYVSQPSVPPWDVPIADARYLINVFYGNSAAARQFYMRETTDPDDTTYIIALISTASQLGHNGVMCWFNTNRQVSVKSAGADVSFCMATTLLYLPIGLSGQF